MSRTTRRPRLVVEGKKRHEIRTRRYKKRAVKVKLTDEQVRKAEELAIEDYWARIKRTPNVKYDEETDSYYHYNVWADRWIKFQVWPVRKWRYEFIELTEDEIQKNVDDEWDAWHRDGFFSESSRKKNFRNDCARTMRRKNKDFCRKVLIDDYEDEPAPVAKETKPLIWRWF